MFLKTQSQTLDTGCQNQTSTTLLSQVTKKSSMEKMPSAAKYSDRSRAPDASHTVSPDTEYRAISNPDQVVTPEDRVKAYRVCCMLCLVICGLSQQT